MVISREFLQSLICKDAALVTGRELATLVIQPVKTLDDVNRLPRLAGPEKRSGKADRVEWHVVLAEKLDVVDVIRLPPPFAPVAGLFLLCPFLRRREISDRRIEPDIEYLMLEALSRHQDAPGEITGDATVAKFGAEAAFRKRAHERRPALAAVEPGLQTIDKLRLPQEQMPRRAQDQVGITGNGGARRDKLHRIKERAAAVALIAARPRRAAMRAGAEDVAIGQEARVRRQPILRDLALLDQPRGLKPLEEMLREPAIGGTG
jgi:hypothetical protein